MHTFNKYFVLLAFLFATIAGGCGKKTQTLEGTYVGPYKMELTFHDNQVSTANGTIKTEYRWGADGKLHFRFPAGGYEFVMDVKDNVLDAGINGKFTKQ